MKNIRGKLKENDMKICNILEHLEVPFEVSEHELTSTSEHVNISNEILVGHKCKNLFLENPKKDEYYIIVLNGDKKLDLQHIEEQIGSKSLCIASEIELYNILKLKLGSVNPFSVVNDIYRKVEILLDYELLDGDNLNFYLCINNKTVNISFDGLEKFLNYMGYNFKPVNII